MKTALQILIAGRAVIALPEHWTQGVLARDAFGNKTTEDSCRAVCFCSKGALNQVVQTDWTDAFDCAFDALSGAMKGDMFRFNDQHTHAEVLAAWDRAIRTAQPVAA